MASVEILRARWPSTSGEALLASIAAAARSAGDTVKETREFEGRSDWLVLYGVGASVNNAARNAQIERGGRVLLWDLGYWDRRKVVGHLRMSIDSDHPHRWLDRSPVDGSRWAQAGIELREHADPLGHILLIGLGRKSREYLNAPQWERIAYQRLQKRFPSRSIVFRPKGRDLTRLQCRTDAMSPIEDLLRGASLVVCRHSNVAVDASIAGVPFECEEGAALWLQQRDFTPANRLDFLQRLSWWQWRTTEASEAWAFAKQVVNA